MLGDALYFSAADDSNGIELWRYDSSDVVSTTDPAVPSGERASVSISPNPASAMSRISVEVERAQRARVSVFDALGREVAVLLDGTLSANEARTLSLDASPLPPGLYVVRLAGENVARTRTLVVAR